MIRALMLSALIIAPVSADVYRYTDANGRVWLTNHPIEEPKPVAKPVVKQAKILKVAEVKLKVVSQKELNMLIHNAAIKYKVDEKLIHAVIKTESTYRTAAVSKKGAVGLMQLMPATASRFGVLDRADVKQNIDGGVKFLSFLLKTFKNTELAIAGYNAGEHAIMRHNNSIPPYPETRNYVGLVMAAYNG
jgi:soluble lytic murein transglycosylase-like protein